MLLSSGTSNLLLHFQFVHHVTIGIGIYNSFLFEFIILSLTRIWTRDVPGSKLPCYPLSYCDLMVKSLLMRLPFNQNSDMSVDAIKYVTIGKIISIKVNVPFVWRDKKVKKKQSALLKLHITTVYCDTISAVSNNIKKIEMAAMPFPCNGILLVQGNFTKGFISVSFENC